MDEPTLLPLRPEPAPWRRLPRLVRRLAILAAASLLVTLALPLAPHGLQPSRAAVMGAATALPFPQAVQLSQTAARTVLERGGAESCLRGKLTKALLGLSSSCEAAGQRSPLCDLADRAAVVTPMSLSFMDETARSILQLSGAPLPSP